MSTITCHLSSIEICEGDDVVILPIKYQHLTETCQLVYGTNQSCTVAHFPLFGKYTDYGQVTINEESEVNCNIFRESVNKGLMNNQEKREKKERSRFYLGDRFYVFKRSEFNEAERTEFYSDRDLIELAEDKDRYLKINEIDSNKELLDFLNIGALTELNENRANRFGYILIRRDIYNSMISEMYSAKKERVIENINKMLDIDFDNDQDALFKIGENYLSRDVLELYNFDSHLAFDTIEIVRLLIKTKQKPEHFIEALLHWSLICNMYSDLGKSLYPNVSKRGTMKHIYTLNSVVQNHIENRKEANRKYYSEKEGYDQETAKREEWNDYSKHY